MFWDTGKNRKAEPNLKSRFVAQFVGVNGDSSFAKLIKTIDLPNLNIDFERAHANEYVHYFQNGQINWEPINITFYDYRSQNEGELGNLKILINTFLSGSQVIHDNRTQIIEQPVFCESIRIIPITAITKDSYPVLGNNSAVDPRTSEKNFVDNLYGNNEFYDSFIILKPRFSKVNFGSYDYSSDEINTISLTIVPQWVDLKTSLNLSKQEREAIASQIPTSFGTNLSTELTEAAKNLQPPPKPPGTRTSLPPSPTRTPSVVEKFNYPTKK